MNTYFPEGGRPFGLEKANPHGSNFLTEAPTVAGAEVIGSLRREILNTIFGTTPEPYFAAQKLLMMELAYQFFGGDEATWQEMPDQRQAIVVDDGASLAGTVLSAATPAVPGGFATVNMPVGAQSYAAAKINARLHFQTGYATIASKTGGNTLVLNALVGQPIPAIVQGAAIPMGAEIRADAERRIVNHFRAQGIERFNYITTIAAAREYGRKEWLKIQNLEQTNRLSEEWNALVYQFKWDMIVEMWNGSRAAQLQDNGKVAKGTDGVKTQMLNGGVVPIPATLGTFIAAHEAASHSTNYRSSGITYNIGPSELLYEISKAYKEQQVRYTPNDMVANLNLDSIKIGSRTHVLVPCDAMADPNYFPGWDGHLFMIDKAALKMAGMRGMPTLDINGTMQRELLKFTDAKGSRDDLQTNPLEATFAPMLINPLSTALLVVS